MVNLLTGPKGSGKTQQMIERANEAVKTCEGNVFFIKKSHRDTYSLSFNIRAICMDDYDVITNTDEYLGFIYGMLSADHDIKAIFIDGILKHADITLENIPSFIETLKKISKENEVIRHNTGRKEKSLWTENGEGEKIQFRQFDSAYDEADYIVSDIKDKVNSGKREYKDFAILYRTNAQSRIFEEKMVVSNVPYKIVGGVNFYARREIKDLLAYLKTVDNVTLNITSTLSYLFSYNYISTILRAILAQS